MSRQILQILGSSIRCEQDATLAKEPLESVGARFSSSATHIQLRPSEFRWWAAGAAALVLVTAGTVFWPRLHPVAFAIKAPASARQSKGQVGVWVSAPVGAPVPIEFADGTKVSVGAESRMRIARSDSERVNLIVERGNLAFDVVHHAGTRWSIATGPFDVMVTGTQFDIKWQPEAEILEVAVRRGSVVVTGCQFVNGKEIRTSEVLRARCGDNLSVTTTQRAGSGEPAPSSSSTPTQDPNTKAIDFPPRDVGQDVQTAASPKWQQLAQKGQYRSAYEIVDHLGFEATCARASASDLLLLTDVARYAGQSARAESAALRLRSHFPVQPQAALAAFTLGRLAFDQARDYGASAKWFGTYLKEQPGGALAREAEGRLMESLARAGQAEEASLVAERYLSKYPEGPHARLAHTLLGSRR